MHISTERGSKRGIPQKVNRKGQYKRIAPDFETKTDGSWGLDIMLQAAQSGRDPVSGCIYMWVPLPASFVGMF